MSTGIRLSISGPTGSGIGRIQVFICMCGKALLRWIGPVKPMNHWRLENDPIDAVRKLTASYVLTPLFGLVGWASPTNKAG